MSDERDIRTAEAIATLRTTLEIEGRATREAIGALSTQVTAWPATCDANRIVIGKRIDALSRTYTAQPVSAARYAGLAGVCLIAGALLARLGPAAWPWIAAALRLVSGAAV